MNLIEKALRYIYIYILTSKAGLEYDLQSREVWRGKPKTSGRNVCAYARYDMGRNVFAKRRIANILGRVERRPRNSHGRCRNYVFHRFKHWGITSIGRENINSWKLFRPSLVFCVGGRLTSKEVAA